MSTRAQILAEIAAQFPDNTTGLITPAKLRQVCEDLANSCNNSTDEGTPAAQVAAHNASASAHLYSRLRELFPLPTMVPVADVSNIDTASATLPTNTTLQVVADENAWGGSVLRVTLGANLTNAKVVLPLKTNTAGLYPYALPKVEFHLSSPAYANMSRLYVWVCENAGATKGRLWIARNDANSTSQFGLFGPYTSAWEGRVRVLSCTPYAHVSDIGSPSAWNESSPRYQVRSIALTVSTGASGAVLDINRVCCQQWARGALITQLDGAYALSYAPIFEEFMSRGWRGVASMINGVSGETMSDSQLQIVASAGWDICQHLSAPGVVAMSATTTEANVRSEVMAWAAYISGKYLLGAGRRTSSNLQNAGPTGFDAASVLRAYGVLSGRGKIPDAGFGIDPEAAATDKLGLSLNYPGGWSPRWGRYNRYYCDAGGGATEAARNTYAGSGLESLVNRCSAGCELGWVYIHRVMNAPTVGNIGPSFASDFLADMNARFDALSVIPITATQADALTYERDGDIYLDQTGLWRSRTSGKIAI